MYSINSGVRFSQTSSSCFAIVLLVVAAKAVVIQSGDGSRSVRFDVVPALAGVRLGHCLVSFHSIARPYSLS